MIEQALARLKSDLKVFEGWGPGHGIPVIAAQSVHTSDLTVLDAVINSLDDMEMEGLIESSDDVNITYMNKTGTKRHAFMVEAAVNFPDDLELRKLRVLIPLAKDS